MKYRGEQIEKSRIMTRVLPWVTGQVAPFTAIENKGGDGFLGQWGGQVTKLSFCGVELNILGKHPIGDV